MTTLGRASRPLIATSIAFIALCVLSLSFALALLSQRLDMIAIVLGFEFGITPIFCAYWQYVGTFRRRPRAAIRASGACFGLAILALFLLIASFIYTSPSRLFARTLDVALAGVYVLLAAFFIYAGSLNRNWAFELVLPDLLCDPKEPPEDDRLRGFRWSVKELFLLMTLIAVIMALSLAFRRALDTSQAMFSKRC